ncbi:MAG: CCA tRNA nucleotidyltransferase [Paracoccaceae bacterium]|nr:CCA tRNA nucleotidyltransferase [Paracoccaceae bacterium]
MNRVTGKWLANPATQAVFDMLERGGFQAWAVGGCVRNALLDQPVTDVDIATDARPEQIMELAGTAGLKSVPTGLEHGTVTIVSGGTGYEVTTFRRDVKTDGRHAKVVFAANLEQDAHRRDFTMNALYADRHGQIRDPLGGLTDLRARCVRFIDDPHARIREDYLRILRFFRFHAWYGDPENGIDRDGLSACAELAEGIERLSRERIGAEIRKLLAAPDPAPGVAAMEQAGVLHRILPGASSHGLAVLVHMETEIGEAPRWLRRLACIGGADAKDRLRLSRNEARLLALLTQESATDTGLAELAYRHGADLAIDVVLLRAVMAGTPPPPDVRTRAEHAARQVFPLGGRDISGVDSGPELGKILKRLERRWIDSGFSLDRQDLLETLPTDKKGG